MRRRRGVRIGLRLWRWGRAAVRTDVSRRQPISPSPSAVAPPNTRVGEPNASGATQTRAQRQRKSWDFWRRRGGPPGCQRRCRKSPPPSQGPYRPEQLPLCPLAAAMSHHGGDPVPADPKPKPNGKESPGTAGGGEARPNSATKPSGRAVAVVDSPVPVAVSTSLPSLPPAFAKCAAAGATQTLGAPSPTPPGDPDPPPSVCF